MTNDQFSSEDLRFLHHQMRRRNMRERNRKRSTAVVVIGLALALILPAVWMAVRG